MELAIRKRGVESAEAPQAEVERYVRSALDRFEPRITRVTVSMLDVNGPRGGVDKVCTVTAALSNGGRIQVQDRNRSAIAAVYNAAHRLAKRIAARLRPGRQHDSVRYPEPPPADRV